MGKKKSAFDVIMELIKWGAIIAAVLFVLNSCDSEWREQSEKQQNREIYDFMQSFSYTPEGIRDGFIDPDDLETEVKEGYWTKGEIIGLYRDLYNELDEAAEEWNRVQDKAYHGS